MPEITVATLNLFNRMGNWESRAPLVIDQCAALAPDILAIQELSLITDQGVWLSREVSERLGGGRFQVKHAASPGKNAAAQGLGVLHRIEPVEHEVLDLMTFDCIAQRLVFEAGGRRFVFVNTHLWFPVDGSVARVRQIEYLLAWLDSRADGLPTIVTGDFNAYAEPPEKTVQIMKARFRSAYETVHGREPEKTWPTPVNDWDKSPAGTLDYVYVSPEWHVLDAGLCFDEPSAENPNVFPSDHIGVYARLGL